MIIYNQTPTSKRYSSGLAMGFLIVPAILLFMQGFILYGIALIIVYLAFETSRTGVDFDFGKSKFRAFREVFFFIKFRKAESTDLNTFSHYRVKEENTNTKVLANWAQESAVSQKHFELELFDKQKSEFLQVVKSDFDQIEPLLVKLEEQNIVVENR